MYDAESIGIKVHSRAGDNLLFVYCPYHENPSGTSAVFNEDFGTFYCFSCLTNKNSIQLGKDFGQSMKRTERKSTAKDEQGWRGLLRNPLAVDSEYLKKRGVNNDTVLKYTLLEDKNKIIFPVGFSDNKTGLIIRNLATGPKYIKLGRIPTVVGYETPIREYAVLVENTFGFFRGNQYGFNTVLMPSTNFKKDIRSYIERFYKLIVWLNNDDAGRRASEKLKQYHLYTTHIFGDPDELDKDRWKKSLEGLI